MCSMSCVLLGRRALEIAVRKVFFLKRLQTPHEESLSAEHRPIEVSVGDDKLAGLSATILYNTLQKS